VKFDFACICVKEGGNQRRKGIEPEKEREWPNKKRREKNEYG
jgi:hypothetical protein